MSDYTNKSRNTVPSFHKMDTYAETDNIPANTTKTVLDKREKIQLPHEQLDPIGIKNENLSDDKLTNAASD